MLAVAPEQAALLDGVVLSAAAMPQTMIAVARSLDGSRAFSGVTRSGTRIPPPDEQVVVVDAADERLPDWVRGHFGGSAWVVLDAGGRVASTAVLKDYDERVREIAVGTEEHARGRGLAKSVVRAAARAVVASGRAVVYNHRIDNVASHGSPKPAGCTCSGAITRSRGRRPRPSRTATTVRAELPERRPPQPAASEVLQLLAAPLVLLDGAPAGRAPPAHLERGSACAVADGVGVTVLGGPVGQQAQRAGELAPGRRELVAHPQRAL